MLLIALLLAAAFAQTFPRGKSAAQLMDYDKFKSLLTTDEKSPIKFPEMVHPKEVRGDLPESFDFRTAWPHCVMPVRDQGQCGSCWAQAAAESLGDRACTSGVVSSGINLSPQWLVQCDEGNNGCMGGTMTNVWSNMAIFGIPEETCLGYTALDGSCPGVCSDGSAPDFFYADTPKYFPYTDLESAMYELMTNGPISTAFSVYTDFYQNYTGGVYEHTWGEYEGGHAVLIIGWGVDTEETGLPYWIIQNSWGPAWGEAGFFRIRRGTNEVGMEGQMTAGLASKSAFAPPIPKFAGDYYTVFIQDVEAAHLGTRYWLKNHGEAARIEEYRPDYKNTTVIKSGTNNGSAISYKVMNNDGSSECKCQKGTFHAQDLFAIPPEFKYVDSVWSEQGDEVTIQEQILSRYVYEVPGMEKTTFSIASASVEGNAYPWSIEEIIMGKKEIIDVSMYSARTHAKNLFDAPCKC